MLYQRHRSWLIPAVIVLGVLFRLIGTVANDEANDNHMEVIHLMATQKRLPGHDELWEAFQPPLYHVAAAAMIVALQPLSPEGEIVAAQAVSCIAGLLTLFILINFIRSLPLSERTRDLAIALTALNPVLISTSIQATNDVFVILFGTMALAGGYRFFRNYGWGAFWTMTIGCVLACCSKGNGMVTAVAVLCTFIAILIRPTISRARAAAFAAAFVITLAVLVPFGGGYVSRHTEAGTPFQINQEPSEPPHLFTETFDKRPGITSVFDGFFTFRLLDMLQDPILPTGNEDYPRHRTSMWSLLYGSSQSVHYFYYPPSWRSNRHIAEWLVRFAIVFSLLPMGVMVSGVVRNAATVTQQTFVAERPREWAPSLLMAFATLGFLAFIALYGYLYRDFATMKAIFVFPAAVAFAYCFVTEAERPGSELKRRIVGWMFGSAAILCLVYAADLTVLTRWIIKGLLVRM